MGIMQMLIILLAAGVSVFAGPYSDEYDGLESTNRFLGWVAGYVEYNQPDPTSGGYSCNDASQGCSISNAIVGCPSAFNTGSTAQHVFSLGNGGSIMLTFDGAIEDGLGPDFAVFENGFTDYSDFTGTSREGATNSFTFAELAFVEVATRTSAWARFPVTCLNTMALHNLNNVSEDRFASQDVTLLDGVAGKHRIEFGTPFDLSALTNDPAVVSGAVDLSYIRYVRLIDVIGDGSTTDSQGRPVYDPYYNYSSGYPNPANTSSTDGFDLRALGVIHFAGVKVRQISQGFDVTWFSATGATYQVQSTTNLFEESWNDLGSPIPGDDHYRTVTDTNQTLRLRNYRVVENREGGS